MNRWTHSLTHKPSFSFQTKQRCASYHVSLFSATFTRKSTQLFFPPVLFMMFSGLQFTEALFLTCLLWEDSLWLWSSQPEQKVAGGSVDAYKASLCTLEDLGSNTTQIAISLFLCNKISKINECSVYFCSKICKIQEEN